MVVFVLVIGMIFLVPVITQIVLGETSFVVYRTNVDFTGMSYYLYDGVFNGPPPKEAFGNDQVWFMTIGSGLYGPEKGYVQYHLLDKGKKEVGLANIEFSNPSKGANTCQANGSGLGVGTKCTITQGVHATAHWCVWYNSPEPTNC